MPRSASPTSESAPPVSPDIAVEAVRTCTHVRMHAHPCAACTQAPAALKPSRLFAYTLDTNCANQIRSGVAPASAVTLRQVWPAAHTQHSTCNTQHATCNTQHATLNMQHAARNTQHSNMQRAAHTAKSRRAPRRSLPRRCRKLARRRVGCRCMCAVGNGRRVTNGLRG